MKLLRDTWLVFGRYFGLFIRNPVWVALGVLQPLLYLLLFAPLLKPVTAVRGFPAGGAYNVFLCPACWSSSACSAPQGSDSASSPSCGRV